MALLKKMTYVNAFVRESQRLIAIVPVNQRVNLKEDIEVGGYKIKKGMCCVVVSGSKCFLVLHSFMMWREIVIIALFIIFIIPGTNVNIPNVVVFKGMLFCVVSFIVDNLATDEKYFGPNTEDFIPERFIGQGEAAVKARKALQSKRL